MTFPDGEFILRNRASGRVMDAAYMSADPGSAVIVYDYKGDDDNSNQLWRFENGQLINKYSGLAITFNDLTPESTATQEEPHGGEGQRFDYDEGYICLADNRDMVVGAWDSDVKIVYRDDGDDARRWDF
ncbi:Ricin B-related lectin [Beauveria brongniartii RCEF 3172]|uniref:Ricin B-related lectin n=1 Tax=Beauveria brongniartii RCEF 3172 TaxID=1081107 RepID=A0A162JJV6_9HYPO|nr:Ricin B-related lectin [Beauveria brongniartii RCEF 3172]